MTNERLYKKITRAIGEKFPANIDTFISAAGYDSERSFLNLNKDSILEIEQYVNENKHILTGTAYAYSFQSTFKFKPGHKSFLLGIPKALEIFNKKNQSKKESSTKPQENNSEEAIDLLEINDEANDVELEIKKQLIAKIISFAQKFSVTLIITRKNIREFRKEEPKFKCKIICPICTSALKCEYKTYYNV